MKSIYQKLGEAVEQITDAGKFKLYREAVKDCTTAEAKLNAAEKILAGKVKESQPITKHNGAGDNGRVTEFRESGTLTLTEEAECDDATYKFLGLSESDQRKLKNLPPVGSPNLTTTQLREYRFLRQINLSESDALRGALKIS